MAGKSRATGGWVDIPRGGGAHGFFRSPRHIEVRFRDQASRARFLRVDAPAGGGLFRVVRSQELSHFPGVMLECDSRARDDLMSRLREIVRGLAYCSHVYFAAEDLSDPANAVRIDKHLFVTFSKKPGTKVLAQLRERHGLRKVRPLAVDPLSFFFEVSDSARENPLKIADVLVTDKETRGIVKRVEPCLAIARRQRAFGLGHKLLWHLADSNAPETAAGANIQLQRAWELTRGRRSVTVAVVDNGFDVGHPALVGRSRHPHDSVDGDSVPQTTAGLDHFHGTACAGIAVGSTTDERGSGVAPGCSWMPIRFLFQNGDKGESDAFEWALTRQADVITCSWGPQDEVIKRVRMHSSTAAAMKACLHDGRNGKGIPIVFAAGNGNEDTANDAYANFPGVLPITAITSFGQRAAYSDFGALVWVCAPSGPGTLQTGLTVKAAFPGGTWAGMSGTSAAAPMVAGVIALMLSKNPDLTRDQIAQILKTTATKINAGATSRIERWTASGFSQAYGWGLVNAGEAVAAA